MHITSLGEILPASLYRDTRSKVELGHSTKATWQRCIESISFCMSVLGRNCTKAINFVLFRGCLKWMATTSYPRDDGARDMLRRHAKPDTNDNDALCDALCVSKVLKQVETAPVRMNAHKFKWP